MSGLARIRYRLDLPDGSKQSLDFFFDSVSFRLKSPPPAQAPFWTELAFNRCVNCPLAAERHAHCPVALQMVRVVAVTQSLVSHDTVAATVQHEERRTVATTAAQSALASIFGLIMATSGCPWTDHLRPMARFHAPFASEGETLYRSISMFALARFVPGVARHEGFEKLSQLCEQLHLVNRGLSRRLGAAAPTDAARNAIALLDAGIAALPDVLDKSLDGVAPLFSAWADTTSEAI